MVITERWKEAHARRFPELPLDCGNRVDPGIVYSEDLRDWSDKATTPDQRRIERYIDRFDLRDKRILHIGIGNSGLAKRFHRRVGVIVGTTIDQPEIDVGEALGLTNYSIVRHNKYSGKNAVPGRFDLIVDNNPTSPCCCIGHLAELFRFYDSKLAENGQIVTDREGLKWVPYDSNARWGFDFDDLSAVGRIAGFSAFRINRNVYVLARGDPAPPHFSSVLRHLGRSARALPRRILSHGLRKLARVAATLIRWARQGTKADR